MKCIEKGLLGINLRLQNISIALIQMLAALLIFIMAIVYLKHPESHIKHLNLNTTLLNITMENERDEKITQVIQKASLMMVGSVATIIACSFLLFGILRDRQRYLILWVGITSFTLCGCLLIFVIRISSQATNTFKTSKIVAIILYFLLNIYFIASVEAYIRKLSRRAILTKDVMVSAMHTDNSNNTSIIQLENYQPLPSDNNGSLRSFYSRAPPVGDIDTDDTSDDEFILYVDDDKKHILKS